MTFISHANASDNAEQRTAELKVESASSPEQRTDIRNLIRQQFPNTDANVIDVWAETYANMSLDEVTFILEQKRRTSNEIGTEFPLPFLSPTLETDRSPSKTDEPADVTTQMVEANLRGAYSTGYRRMVVLPEAFAHSESQAADKPCSIPATSFRSFEPGPRIESPIATHVALTKEDSTMFCLTDNRLTRRGDFQLLKDRRLGIVTSSEEMAAAESTPLPDGATDVQISQNGTIQFRNTAGEIGEAGRITVGRVTDLADLRSEDGVFFTTSEAGNVTRLEDASACLWLKTLEQSNVDRSFENSLLEYLKSQRNTSTK
jgi:flagellar hook protein FlgE